MASVILIFLPYFCSYCHMTPKTNFYGLCPDLHPCVDGVDIDKANS